MRLISIALLGVLLPSGVLSWDSEGGDHCLEPQVDVAYAMLQIMKYSDFETM
jgi:hypothetical protein